MTAWHCNGQIIEFGHRVHVMAVVNLSPESNVKCSVVDSPAAALERGRQCRDWGATIIDLGAQSSHFDVAELSPAEELDRLLPALDLLVADGLVVSVDTWKPDVARVALEHGAAILNDTGGLQDVAMLDVIAENPVPAVVMYIEGANPHAVNAIEVVTDKTDQITARFQDRATALADRGITQLLLDPGLSINYRSDYLAYSRQQMDVIRGVPEIKTLGFPVMIPVPQKRDNHNWMMSYLTLSLEYGADVLRIHDVQAACELARLWGLIP